ncbi:hypothetical protein TNCV_4171301 [Trichonephila clavipes]|nr:hypothetical protein TNCV_4171301 [Trichonephila clavipes]
MNEGLIALNYECSKCNERMGLYERKSAVLDGDFEWVCSTITSQNIYGRTPMILLTSRLFVKIRCHAVASTRKRSAIMLAYALDWRNHLSSLRETRFNVLSSEFSGVRCPGIINQIIRVRRYSLGPWGTKCSELSNLSAETLNRE